MLNIKLFTLIAAILFLACSSWKTVAVHEITPKNLVEITLVSGQTVQGEVLAADAQQIAAKINRQQVAPILNTIQQKASKKQKRAPKTKINI